MNCQEALELLYDYIDKETKEIDEKQVKEHLSKCHDCFDKFSLEEKINSLITAKTKSNNPNGNLDKLKSNILSELDQIDCQMSSKKNKRFNLTAMTLVAAASLVILIGASFFASDFVRHYNLYDSFEQAHFSVSGNNKIVFNDQKTFFAINTIKEKLGYTIAGSVDNFILSGGYFEELMGVEMAHFTYSENGIKVSVFIAPVSEFEIPEDLKENSVLQNNIEMFDHHCRGCRLVFHQTEKAIIITATNDRDVELLNFVPGYSIL